MTDEQKMSAALQTIRTLWAAKTGSTDESTAPVKQTGIMFTAGQKVANAVLTHWKSSVAGLLQAAIGVLIAVASLPPTASKIVIGISIGRALLGFIQKDPDVVIAQVAGESKPRAVPAHPVPDNPSSVAAVDG